MATTEIAVGILVTAGLLTRAAAAVGLALNFILFLTNSWHAYPYFLGSDIVFVFAWLPFVIAGAQGQPALDHDLARRSRPSHRDADLAAGLLTRRVLLRQALMGAGAATLGIAGVAYAVKGSYHGSGTTNLASRRPRGTASASSHSHSHRASRRHAARGTSHTGVPSGAVRLGPSNAVQTDRAATYRDPSDGQPDVVIRDASGKLTAMSAVCTHAGCQVDYQGGELVCPCHGSVFSARTGAVLQGPASQPLAIKHVTESGGEIYALPPS